MSEEQVEYLSQERYDALVAERDQYREERDLAREQRDAFEPRMRAALADVDRWVVRAVAAEWELAAFRSRDRGETA